MKKLVLFFSLLGINFLQAQTIDFVKPYSTFFRKAKVSSYQIAVKVSGITAGNNVTVAAIKRSGDNHVNINMTPPNAALTPGNNGSNWIINIDVDNNIATEDSAYYTFEISYTNYGGTVETKTHLVILTSDEKDFPLVKKDFVVFAGSNIDPKDDKSVITSTSIEAFVKFDFNSGNHMRLGGYSYRNFSADTGSVANPGFAYTNIKPGSDLRVDTTQLIVQNFTLEKKTTTRSYGVYVDHFFCNKNSNKYVRFSPYVRYEYAYRKIESVITNISSKILDTIPLTSKLNQRVLNKEIYIMNTLISKDNLFPVNQIINQHYLVGGVALEYSSKAFEIFAQPMLGLVFSYIQYSNSPAIFRRTEFTISAKIQALIRPLDVTLAADFRGLNSPRPITNFSIGIPLSFSKLKEKFK